jgi:hypothetical protein
LEHTVNGGIGVSSYARVIKEYYPNANVLESLGISGSSIRSTSANQGFPLVHYLSKINKPISTIPLHFKLHPRQTGKRRTPSLLA